MLLIEKEITGIMSLQLSTSEARQDAYSDFTTTLEALIVYIKTQTPASTRSFGLGYGKPPPSGLPIDIGYAAGTIVQMLGLREQVGTLSDVTPSFDLSDAELYEQNLSGMNLSWVNAYMVSIDLRGAFMGEVHLSSRDDLQYAHLQCANLIGAHLQGAHLEYANLSGADLAGAELQGAYLTGADLHGAIVDGADFHGALIAGANLTDMIGPPIGLPRSISTLSPVTPTGCPLDKSLWDTPSGGLAWVR